MAAEIKDAFAIDPNLVKGGNGAFEVAVDGELIFSKNQTHRFPDVGEITSLLKSR